MRNCEFTCAGTLRRLLAGAQPHTSAPATPGMFAANCLLARRLAERDVRFIQLYHPGWDHHGGLPKRLPVMCKEVDQGCGARITDLKQRGLLDDTLVIWGGEFGRTSYSQGKLTSDDYGRDHHPRVPRLCEPCLWVAVPARMSS